MANVNVNAVVSDGQFSRVSSTYDNLKASLTITEETVETVVQSKGLILTTVFKIKACLAEVPALLFIEGCNGVNCLAHNDVLFFYYRNLINSKI